MTVTVYSRETNGKKGKWEFHSMYIDGMPNGKKREKEYAGQFKRKDNKHNISELKEFRQGKTLFLLAGVFLILGLVCQYSIVKRILLKK